MVWGAWICGGWGVSLGKNRPADFKTGGQNFCLSLKKKK